MRLRLLVCIYYYTFSNFSSLSLSLYFPTSLYFTIKLSSSFLLSHNLTLLLLILLCINLISFFPFNSYFFPKKKKNCKHSLSLSLSLSLSTFFWGIFFLSYNSNLSWWILFYFIILMCFDVMFFKFSSQIPLISLVEFWFGLIFIFIFLEIRIWIYIKKICLSNKLF